MHFENQLPRLPGTSLIVITSVVWWCGDGGVIVWYGLFTNYNTAPTKVVL